MARNMARKILNKFNDMYAANALSSRSVEGCSKPDCLITEPRNPDELLLVVPINCDDQVMATLIVKTASKSNMPIRPWDKQTKINLILSRLLIRFRDIAKL